MKTIGLTGLIGSGKSLICSVFEHLGIPVFLSDNYAKELYKDTSFLEEIVSVFGQEVFNKGVLDKKILANIVFNDKEKLEKLNSMIHPKVLEMFLLWSKNRQAPYVILESAILFEIGWEKYFDKTICISTPKDIAIERALKRDKVSKQDIEKRMSNQFSNEDKCKRADFIIFHDNKTMLLPQILEIHNIIKQKE